jgi:hypothetical protein
VTISVARRRTFGLLAVAIVCLAAASAIVAVLEGQG